MFGSVPITVLDDEKAPKLTLAVPKNIAEGAAKSIGHIKLDGPVDVDVLVKLGQNPKGRVNCPKNVVIRARKTTGEFKIGAVDDGAINGDAAITIAASAAGISTSSARTLVVDNEPLNLRLKLPAEVVEGTAATGSVELSGRITKALTVTLKNGDPSRLGMPTTVTIPAGHSSASFDLIAKDRFENVSVTNVSIQATAPKFTKATGKTRVREIVVTLRVKSLDLATNDLLWDAQRQVIYASVPASAGEPCGNHVVAINPATRTITASLAVNQGPGQLAITSGGEYLYVARNGNGSILKIALSSFTESQNFAVGADPYYGTLYAEDICTVAGQPDLLVVAQYRKGVSPRHNRVVVYDNGVARAVKTRDHTGSNAIEPSADPNIFFGYNTESSEFGFRRIQLNATGLTELSVNETLLDGYNLDIRSDGDRVYSTNGVALDGKLSAIRGSFPLPSSTNLVCPDQATNRVYFMEARESYSDQYARIVAYDPVTFLPVHGVTLPQLAESPGSFIRWGDSGLAYRTAGTVVFVTDKELVPSGPPADLSVTVQAAPNPATVSGKLIYTINVTNAGPNAAANVVVNAALSPRQSVFSTSATKGSRLVSGLNVSLTLASLAAGATETPTVVSTPQSAGSLICTTGVSSEAVDPNSANNAGFKLVSVGFQTAINKVNELNLAANDIVADPKRKLLWASIPGTEAAPLGKSVVSIDPLTGLVSDPLPINANPNPGSMALSANGRYLYIGLADAPEVHRIDLDTVGYPAVRIPLGLSQWGSANYAQDIKVLEGDGTSFIFAGSGDHAAAIFDGTVRRPDRTSIYSVDSLARTGTSGVFIGYDNYTSGFELTRLSATATGVSTLLKFSNVVSNYGVTIAGDGNFVLSSNGRLGDSRTLTLIADLAVSGKPCVDAANQRVYMASGGSLLAYQTATGNPAGTFALRSAGSSDWPQQCIRWGTDGLAVLGNDGKIAIARWSLAVPAAPPRSPGFACGCRHCPGGSEARFGGGRPV